MTALLRHVAASFLAAAFLLLTPTPSAAIAQSTDEIEGPQDGAFLIEGIRIWSNGELSEPTTLLLRDGWVVAQGAAASADGIEVTTIEAADDWVLYPGLIHGNFPAESSGYPQNPYAIETTDPRTGPVTAMELGTLGNLYGWTYVADRMAWSADSAEDWRELGFTTGHVVPSERALARGQSAVVSLNGRPLGQALLKREGFHVYSLSGARGGYPGTPMASLAMLRQMFLDAGRDPVQGRTGRSLMAEELAPAVFFASGRREIENVLDLHRDYMPQGSQLILLGGREARHFVDRLQEQKVSVLYIADFGEAPKSEEDLEVEPLAKRPYWQEPAAIRDQERADHAEQVGEFATLREAGITCALVPNDSPKAWKDAWQQMADAGLSADTLWQAASTDLAAILGHPTVSSNTAGAGADFVIYAGEAGPAQTPAWVFADGRGWQFPLEEEGEDESEDGSADSSDVESGPSAVNGTWKIVVQTPQGEEQFYAIIDRAAETVGVTDNPGNPLDEVTGIGFQDPDRVKFSYYVEEMQMNFTFFGKADGDKMTAKLATDFGDVPATGERVAGGAAPEGDFPETESEVVIEVQEESSDQEEEASTGLAKGHPEWLVETDAMRQPANPFAGTVLIKGGTLYPVTGVDPYVGDLLIEDGRITAIGESIAPPAGVPVFDAEGMHVSPAMLDAHSHLALASINEGSMSITAEVHVGDMILTGNYGIYRAAAGGTALVQSLHGSANPIGGRAAIWEMDYFATRIEDVLYPGAKQGIKFALGENVKQSNWNNQGNRFPNSRMGVQAVYRRAFRDAQDYAARRQLHEDGKLPGFRRDVRLEVLADILANKVHIQCHSYRADELQMFLNVCKEFGIERPTFQHVLEGYKVAPELAAYGAMGSSFADWWAYKIEAYDAIPYNPAMMHDAGMVSSINSDSDDLIRRLNTEAGKSIRYAEIDWETAMSFATKNVATQLWIDETLGTLEVGKHGTVAVWDAPPLSTYARCHLTLARGRTIFEWKEGNDETWEAYAKSTADYASKLRGDVSESTPQIDISPEEWKAWTHLGEGEHDFIENAIIHTMADGAAPFRGWVETKDGEIVRVGRGDYTGRKPTGARMIDASGLNLYPGFINGTDATGLYEIGSVRGTDDRRETGSNQPDLSIASAIHADSAHHDVTRMHGITHVFVRPSFGRIQGQAALIQLEGDTTDEMIVSRDHGLVIRFPRASAPSLGTLGRADDLHDHDCLAAGIEDEHEHENEPEGELNPREGVQMPDSVDELDQWFDDALDYGEAMESAMEQGIFFERDAKLEALVPYARGQKPVYIEANDAITIMAARAWGKDRGLDLVYLGAKEAWKVAGYLGADHARVVLGSVMDLPNRSTDPYDANWRGAMVLRAAGCQVALRTDNPEVSRNLPFQAAAAAAWGLGREHALRALTIDAARILGVDAFTGSIEAGKSANFFLCSGDPLDFTGHVRRMWIGGREVPLTNKQTELRDRYQARIDAMKD